MNKENILYAIIGIMLGLIGGFLFANSYLRSELASGTVSTASTMPSNSNMPAGHPDINGQQPNVIPPADVQAAVDDAKKKPTDFEAQTKAAAALYRAGKFDESLDFLKIANKLKPDDYETTVNLGNVAFDGGKFDEAEKWYSAALQKKKEDNDVRTDLGLIFVFRETPDYDRALKEFNTVLASEPNHAHALQNSVVAYTRKGDLAKAKENLTKLESVDPQNEAISKLKEQLNKSGAN